MEDLPDQRSREVAFAQGRADVFNGSAWREAYRDPALQCDYENGRLAQLTAETEGRYPTVVIGKTLFIDGVLIPPRGGAREAAS